MVLAGVAKFSGIRALAWQGNVLYAARGYSLLRATIRPGATQRDIQWERVARHSPVWWRQLTSRFRLTFRLFRDGFHAMAVLDSGHIIAAVPGSIVTLLPGENRFRKTHRVVRGTRPLHIAAAPDGRIYWGEYFGNPERDEVHIYSSSDRGSTWSIAYTFPKGAVRHVHNIVYDEWADCLWVLTGDNGAECRILRASLDFSTVEVVLEGNQQARAVSLVPTAEGIYFSSDTPFESNHVYFIDRAGVLSDLATLSSSSIYGAGVGNSVVFSTMVEPSTANPDRHARLFGSIDGRHWEDLLHWEKDAWPLSFFQYGNILLPDGRNRGNVLAVSTVAVKGADLETSLWSIGA
jgi:hypothetical protein